MNFFKFIFKWTLLLGIWVGIGVTAVLFYYFQGLPSLSDLETKDGKQVIEINYADGNRITNRGEIYSSEVQYYEIPEHLINAVVATEDRRFFKHHGVDIFGIMRAFYVNRKAERVVQGGSTITQQLAKLLFLKSERTLKRKIQEVLLALQLERHFTKEEILTFYLNRAYFGSGNYGVGNAAKYYFKKDVSQLSLNEAALLAGLLKAPSKLSPKNNKELAEERANVVISNMIDAGYLDEKNLREINQDISYKNDRAQRLYFADFVTDQLPDFLGKKQDDKQVISVVTTLDENFQAKLENVVDKFINKHQAKLNKSQLAVVVMDKSGAIRAIAGGKDYRENQFNRATYAKRQPGSAFKTFVYLAAFENGFKIDDVFEDRKINVGAWLPENYNNHYLGNVTLKRAFAESLNSVAVQLGRQVGGDKIAAIARKCGIMSPINSADLTIALGTNEVTLLELTGAYATIAGDGVPVIPYAILSVKGDNELLFERQSSGLDRVISEEALTNIKEVLNEVVVRGTGSKVGISHNIYGKTGTSQNFRDAWFVGFDENYVVGVWIGNDDGTPTDKITGGSLPAELFGEII